MTWIKLDDQAVDHPKVASLTDRAFRWWVRGLSYASRFLTDGVLPHVFIKSIPKTVVGELVAHGLWKQHGDTGCKIHDYLHHQTRKEDVEQEKARNRDKAAAYRERRRTERRVVTGDVTGNTALATTLNGYQIVPNPENREQIQRTDTERTRTGNGARPRGGGLITSPMADYRTHGQHVLGFCEFVCFPQSVFYEFVARVTRAGFPEPENRVLVWAERVRDEWTGRIPGSNKFKFWENEWEKTHGSNRPSTAGVDVTAGLRDA